MVKRSTGNAGEVAQRYERGGDGIWNPSAVVMYFPARFNARETHLS